MVWGIPYLLESRMKKLKRKLFVGALAAGGALTFTACANRPQCVYGPPPDIPADLVEVETSAEPETFDVNSNIPEDVYGPPSYWEGEDEGEIPEESFEAEENIPALVYGPPE